MGEDNKKIKKEDYEKIVNELNFHEVNTATQETTKSMREEISKENEEVTL